MIASAIPTSSSAAPQACGVGPQQAKALTSFEAHMLSLPDHSRPGAREQSTGAKPALQVTDVKASVPAAKTLPAHLKAARMDADLPEAVDAAVEPTPQVDPAGDEQKQEIPVAPEPSALEAAGNSSPQSKMTSQAPLDATPTVALPVAATVKRATASTANGESDKLAIRKPSVPGTSAGSTAVAAVTGLHGGVMGESTASAQPGPSPENIAVTSLRPIAHVALPHAPERVHLDRSALNAGAAADAAACAGEGRNGTASSGVAGVVGVTMPAKPLPASADATTAIPLSAPAGNSATAPEMVARPSAAGIGNSRGSPLSRPAPAAWGTSSQGAALPSGVAAGAAERVDGAAGDTAVSAKTAGLSSSALSGADLASAGHAASGHTEVSFRASLMGIGPAPSAQAPGGAVSHAVMMHEPAAVQEVTQSGGARQIEAGYRDSALGWVSVRAVMSADGAVHASLAGSSVAATGHLTTMLPAVHRFLSESDVSVHSLTSTSRGPDTGAGNRSHEQSQPQQMNLSQQENRNKQPRHPGQDAPASDTARQPGRSTARNPGNAPVSVPIEGLSIRI